MGHRSLAIARSEYRLFTSSIRTARPYFPYLVIGLLAVYVTFLAPAIVSLFINDFLAVIVSEAAIPLVQTILFTFFLCLMLFPIADTLREVQTRQLEVLLAAPVRPNEVLLGKFLGKVPFYAVAITAITATLTALLNSLGLDMIQKGIVIVMFIITFLSATWIGTVIPAILHTKLGRTMHGKDVGRALSVIIVLPPIAIMYAIMGGGLMKAFVDPSTSGVIRAVLGVLPSSWAAEVFVGFASSPGNIGAVGLETTTRLAGLIAFFLAVLWLGGKAANRAYRLESTSFTASRAKPDGLFYGAIRWLGGNGSFGTLVASVFKDYGRRLENLSWIMYILGVIAMMTMFLTLPFSSTREPLVMLSLMGIPMLAAFVIGTVSRGKATLFLYRKAPHGMGRFLKARLLQDCLVTVPIAAAIMAVLTALVPHVTLSDLFINVAMVSLRTMASVAFLLGLALLIPVFGEGSRERASGAMVDLQIAFFVAFGLEIGLPMSGFSLRRVLPDLAPFTALLLDHVLKTAIMFLAGIALLLLGKAKLDRIE